MLIPVIPLPEKFRKAEKVYLPLCKSSNRMMTSAPNNGRSKRCCQYVHSPFTKGKFSFNLNLPLYLNRKRFCKMV